MIATDEIKATINRLNLLATNTESVEEKLMANLLVANLGELMKQAVLIAGSPQFKQQVELEKENAEDEKLNRQALQRRSIHVSSRIGKRNFSTSISLFRKSLVTK